MDDDRRSRFPPALIAAAVLVLPVLYVLAAGPTSWLIVRGYIDSESGLCTALRAIYQPLTYFAEHCPPFNSFLNWYFECWRG